MSDIVMSEIVQRLRKAFPNSFINNRNEFVAECTGKTNEYFQLDGCETEEDVECKVLEWLSRAACKTEPYVSAKKNDEFHKRMRDGINDALDTNFSEDDMMLIYTKLGNCVKHKLTMQFVKSGYNLMVLDKEQEEKNDMKESSKSEKAQYVEKDDVFWMLEHLDWTMDRKELMDRIGQLDTTTIPTYKKEYLEKDALMEFLKNADKDLNREELIAQAITDLEVVVRDTMNKWEQKDCPEEPEL